MVCCCLFCGGKGFCSNLLSILISFTFSFHAVGIFGPAWMCRGLSCSLTGLYYTCDGMSDCERLDPVPSTAVLLLCFLVLVSSLLLSIVFCGIVHCTKFEWRKITVKLAIVIGGWYAIQESCTTAVLVILLTGYDRIGWSAYVFIVPGLVGLVIVMFVLVYMMAKPKHRAIHVDIEYDD